MPVATIAAAMTRFRPNRSPEQLQHRHGVAQRDLDHGDHPRGGAARDRVPIRAKPTRRSEIACATAFQTARSSAASRVMATTARGRGDGQRYCVASSSFRRIV